MKKFILKFLLFLACVVVMDFMFGIGFSWLRSHAKGGSTANCEYIANQANEDIIILGSSRATHHYVPEIIEDSLGMSCYNCGEEGNGVVLAYGRLKMLTNRYKPKLVIYEITPGYDYDAIEPNNKYLGYLRAYYDIEGISDIFDDFDDDLSCLKMWSRMYQNTSRLLPDIVDNIIFRDNHHGYEPLYGKMKEVIGTKSKKKIISIDSLKLLYLEKLIVLCKRRKIPLLFMASPKYDNEDNTNYEPAIELCKRYGVEFRNYINDLSISKRSELFQDIEHLNNEGATLFSQKIIPTIKAHLNNI